jgi:drug/metabolite transporter (DMT)-like permease
MGARRPPATAANGVGTRARVSRAENAADVAVVATATKARHAATPTSSSPQSPAPLLLPLLRPLLALLVWGAISSSIILTNKRVYAGGFPYPCALTGVGNGFSALAALAAARLAAAAAAGGGKAPPDFLRVRPPRAVLGLLPWVAPTAVATALSMALGNFPYLYVSVSLIQMLKASSPAWTLLLAAAAGLETPTPALAGSVLLVAAGTAAAVLFQEDEGGAGAAGGAAAAAAASSSSLPAAAALGVALTLLSCLVEAARAVGSQALLQQERGAVGGSRGRKRRPAAQPPLNALESLVYVGGPASLLLLLASLALREGGSPLGLARDARRFALRRPGTAAAAVASSAAVNFASMAAVRCTSSLTFKVSGCAKSAAVMALAAAEHGDRVTRGQAGGFALATGGFVAYAWAKARQGGGGGG